MGSVVITGVSRGIGKATATQFLEQGHTVFACTRNIDQLKQLMTQFPKTCIPVFLDFQNIETVQNVIDAIEKYELGVDYVIHNAGYLVNKPFLDIQAEELLSCYTVNVLGPFQLTQQLFRWFNAGSHTVFISSMGGFQGSVKFPGLTAYSSSKSSEASLAECLQAEFAAYSHSFNCLCLGAVQTEMLQDAFPGYDAPLLPDQMASFIYQFTTTSSKFIRGKVIPVSLSTP